jgi:hypothetical protein
MSAETESVAEGEPPHSMASHDGRSQAGDAKSADLVDRIIAVAHLRPSAHVAVIGRHTLSIVLELLRHGCAGVRSLRPGAPSPDCEAADLAWIVDAQTEGELDEALRAARSRAGNCGRVIVEGAEYSGRDGVAAIRAHAAAVGLDVISFDHIARRLVLANVQRPALSA